MGIGDVQKDNVNRFCFCVTLEGRRVRAEAPGCLPPGEASPLFKQMLFCDEVPSASDAMGCCAIILYKW